MVVRNHPRGRLVFDRDAIVRAALRAYVESMVAGLPNGMAYEVCPEAYWTGDVQHGAFKNYDGGGNHEVVAWTDAGVVGLAYQLGFGPIDRLGMTPDTVTGGPEDVRGAVPGLPAALEPAFQMAASMLDTRSDLYNGKLPNKAMYSEKLAGIGFWLYDDRVEGTLFTDPKAPGAIQLLPWGMLQNGRLPFWVLGELATYAAERARTRDAPIHAIIDAVVDRRMRGPTEFTTDEIATLIPKPHDPERQRSVQRTLQKVGITWPGSPELPPEPPPPEPRINPFTGKPMPKANRPDK